MGLGECSRFYRPDPACAAIFGAIPLAAISFLLGALVSRFGWIAVGKISGRGPGIGFCLAEVTHTSSLSRRTSISELQNHALDMRVNVEGRRAQKTYERLVVVACELDRKT